MRDSEISRVELNTGIILQNQENGVIHIQWNLEMVIILQECQSIWIRILFHYGFQSFSQKVDMILLKLNELTEFVGQEIKLDIPSLLSCMFVRRFKSDNRETVDDKELVKQALYMTSYLFEIGYVKGINCINGDVSRTDSYYGEISITPKGYDRIDQLQQRDNEGKDALVAMRFGSETLKLREAIREGIFDAGYHAIFIDEVEHNGFITPELLSRINKSRFVVVDLTHRNNGAYFEEGYAMGLGKTVIQLCKRALNYILILHRLIQLCGKMKKIFLCD